MTRRCRMNPVFRFVGGHCALGVRSLRPDPAFQLLLERRIHAADYPPMHNFNGIEGMRVPRRPHMFSRHDRLRIS